MKERHEDLVKVFEHEEVKKLVEYCEVHTNRRKEEVCVLGKHSNSDFKRNMLYFMLMKSAWHPLLQGIMKLNLYEWEFSASLVGRSSLRRRQRFGNCGVYFGQVVYWPIAEWLSAVMEELQPQHTRYPYVPVSTSKELKVTYISQTYKI